MTTRKRIKSTAGFDVAVSVVLVRSLDHGCREAVHDDRLGPHVRASRDAALGVLV